MDFGRGQPQWPQQTRPKTLRLSLKALFTFPYRMCNPPPAVGKVRSLGVTPIFDVRLKDVLDAKHLPPLGLKDFEEWLLFVENAPENLYFVLWLREYTRRYGDWIAECKSKRPSRCAPPSLSCSPAPSDETATTDTPIPFAAYDYHFSPTPAEPSPSLAMFYQRAKQTFLTPNAPYELNIPSDVLAPFHTSLSSPASPYRRADSPSLGFRALASISPAPPSCAHSHPDPAIFAEVSQLAHDALRASLSRFVLAAYSNVGTNRGLCGIIGGLVIALAGSLPVLVLSFLDGWSRWLRLTSLPGLWLGLTIIVASLNGVCMMIYIFGDFRQLRKFELSRPPISQPQPHPDPVSVTNSPRRLSSNRSPAKTKDATKSLKELISLPNPLSPRLAQKSAESPPVHVPVAITRPPAPILSRKGKGPASTIQSAGHPHQDELGQRPPRLRVQIPNAPGAAVIRDGAEDVRPLSRSSASSQYSEASYASDFVSSEPRLPRIEISPAYFDEDPKPEGPATSTMANSPGFVGEPRPWEHNTCAEDSTEGTTARFISVWEDSDSECESVAWDVEQARGKRELVATTSPRKGRGKERVDAFDFDGLPPRPGTVPHPYAVAVPYVPAEVTTIQAARHLSLKSTLEKEEQEKKRARAAAKRWGLRAMMGRAQEWCVKRMGVHVARATVEREAEDEKFPDVYAPWQDERRTNPRPSNIDPSTRLQYQRSVPAFASPLTRILSPIVTRAQWEIVVKSAVVALLLTWIVEGAVLGIPVRNY